MQLLNKITLRECSALSEAEILFRACPQDNLAGHTERIVANIKNGKAKLFEVLKTGNKIGFVCVEIYGKEFVIVAMHTTEHCHACENVLPIFEEWAKTQGCKCITFSTVRPGLITKAQEVGFIVSEIVMRKHL